MTTVDAYCFENNISEVGLLKIDVEGHDFFVLHGARQCGLPDAYVAEIERVTAVRDLDIGRETRELSIYATQKAGNHANSTTSLSTAHGSKKSLTN